MMALWIEALVGLLLVASGLLSLLAAIGLVSLPDFFQRMHPLAICSTLSLWCVALASAAYFSWQAGSLTPHAVLLPLLLAITTPVTTMLLARAVLFRLRGAGLDVPTTLARDRGAAGAAPAKEQAQ